MNRRGAEDAETNAGLCQADVASRPKRRVPRKPCRSATGLRNPPAENDRPSCISNKAVHYEEQGHGVHWHLSEQPILSRPNVLALTCERRREVAHRPTDRPMRSSVSTRRWVAPCDSQASASPKPDAAATVTCLWVGPGVDRSPSVRSKWIA